MILNDFIQACGVDPISVTLNGKIVKTLPHQRRAFMRSLTGYLVAAVVGLLSIGVCRAHDIPDANVDRSIQVDIHPDRIRIDYEISLSELTLTQDLKALIGQLPGAERAEWFKRYAEETGPLNARGLIVTIDGQSVEPAYRSYDLVVDAEPHFTFHVEAAIPSSGRLRLIDSNYAAAEGTSRLAVRGRDGSVLEGDSLPTDVKQIAPRPVWQLSAVEERRSKQVQVDYHAQTRPTEPKPVTRIIEPPRIHGEETGNPAWAWLTLCAFFLGISADSPSGQRKTSLAFGLAASVIEFASLSALAGMLWITGVTESAGANLVLRHSIGFGIAAFGLWRMGRRLGDPVRNQPDSLSARQMIFLDALVLLIFAILLGQALLTVILAAGFGFGRVVVLVIERLAISKSGTDSLLSNRHRGQGIMNGASLATMGVALLTNGFGIMR